MTKTYSLKVNVYDKTNKSTIGFFSNAPLGCEISFDLENWTMTVKHKAGTTTVCDIAPNDVFELQVTKGLLNQ